MWLILVGFVLKKQYCNNDKLNIKKKRNDADKKIPDAKKYVKKLIIMQKITEIECKILSITGLAGTGALNFVKDKIPNVSDLVKKYRLRCRNIRHQG